MSVMRIVKIKRRCRKSPYMCLHHDNIKSTLTAICHGSVDLSERSSISVGFFHTRRPEKADTGDGVTSRCSLP
jgi:hypothetical protein